MAYPLTSLHSLQRVSNTGAPFVQLEGVIPEPDVLEKGYRQGLHTEIKIVPIELTADQLKVRDGGCPGCRFSLTRLNSLPTAKLRLFLADEADIDEAIVRLYGTHC